MECKIDGTAGRLQVKNESYAVCMSSANLEASTEAIVSLSLREAPQLNAIGKIVINPLPQMNSINPSSGLTHGGTKVIIRGTNFRAIGTPFCYFGEVAVSAYVTSEKSISCFTPEKNAGTVNVRVSLDDRRTLHGGKLFSFFDPIVLYDISPTVAVNGTELVLTGDGFRVDLPIKCSLGNSSFVTATVHSLNQASCVCIVPAETPFGVLSVSLVTASEHAQVSIANEPDATIIYHPSIEITSVSRLYESVLGGESSIEIQVSGTMDDVMYGGFDSLRCHFGKKAVLALFYKSAVTCKVPPAENYKPGNVSLSLFLNGGKFSDSVSFEYVGTSKVTHISPNLGPYTGATSVRVYGVLPHGGIFCRFGPHESYGYYDTDQKSVFCITPAVGAVSSLTLFLKLSHKQDWIDTGVNFHFDEPISVEKVVPIEISRGVKFIQVMGKGYHASSPLICCYGEGRNRSSTEAIYFSNTTLKCPLPVNMEFLGRRIPFSLTSNNVDFTISPYPLAYQGEQIVMTSLSPAAGPTCGHTLVDVYGFGFKENSTIACWF